MFIYAKPAVGCGAPYCLRPICIIGRNGAVPTWTVKRCLGCKASFTRGVAQGVIGDQTATIKRSNNNNGLCVEWLNGVFLSDMQDTRYTINCLFKKLNIPVTIISADGYLIKN